MCCIYYFISRRKQFLNIDRQYHKNFRVSIYLGINIVKNLLWLHFSPIPNILKPQNTSIFEEPLHNYSNTNVCLNLELR